MSSLADNRAYFEAIQAYFLERTGKGLMLSSRDLELLMGWCQSGAPIQSICRGIDEAVERLNSNPRDLYAVRKFVDRRLSTPRAAPVFEARAAREVSPQNSGGPFDDALELLQAALEKATRSELTAALHEVMLRVRAAKLEDAEPWGVLANLDDFLVTNVFERLGEDERRLIDLEIEAQHGPSLAMMGDEARAATMLESRRMALTKRWELPSLIG